MGEVVVIAPTLVDPPVLAQALDDQPPVGLEVRHAAPHLRKYMRKMVLVGKGIPLMLQN